MELLILPHQLFDKSYFPKEKDIKTIFLYEHPQYFTKYKFNKKKLILHRASMKYYEDYLMKAKYTVKYIEYNKPITSFITSINSKNILYFDPIDKIKTKGLASNNMIESPNFLLTKDDYSKYREKTNKFLFNNFYIYGKKIIDIIPDVKSQDKKNRENIKLNSKLDIPKISKLSREDKNYIDEAIKYVNNNFPNNYGNTEDFIYPITHKTAGKWLDDFISKKFKKFGPYQDFIIPTENYMFHSILSASINIGLINPLEIIEKIRGLKSKIPLNSYEGYIRQLYWREYQRYTYIYFNFNNKNYFGNRKKLNNKWYTGETGIVPVDDAIKNGFDTGYLHHILRLMVVGNWMNLSGISPKEGFKWFMEFSCDSYEWVMCQNVFEMVFCISGGETMSKPYISSSNYVIKMSHYKKGDWSNEWDETFREFCKKNKKKLWKFRYFFPFITKY